jgi:hypothetical protein
VCVFIPVYLENSASHRYLNGNGNSFFMATFEMCGNPSDQPKSKSDKFYVYLSEPCLFLIFKFCMSM